MMKLEGLRPKEYRYINDKRYAYNFWGYRFELDLIINKD